MELGLRNSAVLHDFSCLRVSSVHHSPVHHQPHQWEAE